LENFTSIIESEPSRNVANYMMWRVVKESIGFLNKIALELLEDYTRFASLSILKGNFKIKSI